MTRLYPNPIKLLKLIIVIVSIVVFNSCFPSPDPEELKTENEYIYSAFQEWYLWYDQIPVLDPNSYKTQEELLKAIKVDVDRWSFTASYAEIKKLLEGGIYTGFGGGFTLDSDNQIKITHVYTNSPFGKFGVERGWIVETVNGYGVTDLENVNNALASSNDVEFVFIDFTGTHHTTVVKKEPITMNTVLYSTIYREGLHKIGYVVFESFLNTSVDELKKVFQIFQQEGITDLIVDVRYNGGGVVDVGHQLTGMIGGNNVKNKVISKVIHNDKHSTKNTTTVSNYEGPSVNIDKVYFLTSSSTASASELVINSLKPYMDVKLVGSTTHGKPVGMYVLSIEKLDLAIVPISFKNTNCDDFGDYFQGFPVQIEEADDLSHNWGDKEEAMLKAAINDIIEPVLASTSLKSKMINKQKNFEYSGLNQYINAW